MTLAEQMAYQSARLKKRDPPAEVEKPAEPEKKLEDMTLAEQMAYQSARLKKKDPPAEPKPVEEEKKAPAPEENKFEDSFMTDDSMLEMSRVDDTPA